MGRYSIETKSNNNTVSCTIIDTKSQLKTLILHTVHNNTYITCTGCDQAYLSEASKIKNEIADICTKVFNDNKDTTAEIKLNKLKEALDKHING